MVGHTHDDVDQMFSCFSRGIKKQDKNIFTLDGLMEIFRGSYSPSPRVVKMEYIQDWKSFFDSFSLSGSGTTRLQLHGHLRPLQFWFTRLPSSNEGRAYLRFKKLSADEAWHPVNEDTPPTLFFTDATRSLNDLRPFPLKTIEEDVFKEVFNSFVIASRDGFGMTDDQKDCFPNMLLSWSGWMMVDKIPVNVGSCVQLSSVVDIAADKKWALKEVVDGRVHFLENGVLPDDDDGEDDQLLVADVDTDDDELVYRGNLHSSKSSSYKTNIANFIDPTAINVGQLILVRVDNSNSCPPIELCKVVDLMDDEEDHMRIQWYGGNSFTGAQNPLVKSNKKGGYSRHKKGSKSKNIPYLDTIHVNSILTDMAFDLNTTKKIPHYVRKMAEQRLTTVSAIQGSVASSSKK